MFDPGGVGEWSPPQSPFGGVRGKKRKSSPLQWSICSFIREGLKAQPVTGSKVKTQHAASLRRGQASPFHNKWRRTQKRDQSLRSLYTKVPFMETFF
jgi:hypothetical protein